MAFPKLPSLSEIRKAVAAFAAVATAAVASGLITGSAAVFISGLVASVVSFFATYAVKPNVPSA